MHRHGIVNKDGKVVNVVIWDGINDWRPQEGHIAIRHDEINIDDKWDHEKKELVKRHFCVDSDIVESVK